MMERAMNVISCEDKGEEKITEAESMPSKQATIAEEPSQMTTNDGANKKEKKRKKKASMTRRKIGIINFPVKSKPQDLIEEVQRQEPKLTWPQLLHLSPRMQRQWSKMVSTRRSKNVNTLKAQVLEDALHVLAAQIKGQRVSREYVDEGAQVCVISEKMMHKLRLEVSGPSGFKGNDVSVKYVGVVTMCGIQVSVNMYGLPTKGEGYPVIQGRPWLIAMNARQDWESGTLLLKPPRKKGKSVQTIVYNMKEGRRESLELGTSEDEWSAEDSSSMAEVTNSVSDSDSEEASSLEAMGVVLIGPTTKDGGKIKETLSDVEIEGMLSTNLSKEESKVMLQKHSPPFISDYKQIKGVTMVEHQVNLNQESKPIAQNLRRLGRIQHGALLTKVKRLLQADFIHPMEDSKWVSSIVVTPKENGKWRWSTATACAKRVARATLAPRVAACPSSRCVEERRQGYGGQSALRRHCISLDNGTFVATLRGEDLSGVVNACGEARFALKRVLYLDIYGEFWRFDDDSDPEIIDVLGIAIFNFSQGREEDDPDMIDMSERG
ncbi:hypothetical protein L7F22_057405 [Adiantum nelumboides]|nr:hypothetical protein [Adiantum nelumboides]